MTIRGGVGDIFPVVLPAHFVAAVLHEPDEVFTVTGQGHTLIDIDFQIHLPAIALGIGTVFSVRHGAFFFLLFLGFYDRQTILRTQFVRCFPKHFQGILIAMVFEAGVAAYRVDHEMRMDMISVRMRCDYDFKPGDLLRQL